jgi:ribonucleoside-triphosphate reductase
MFILLCGTGVGFSVERQFVTKLPEVPELFDSETTVVVKDSKEGWAKSLRQVIALLYSGEIPKWDVSRVRPAGARLKTFGGRASGPAPLVDLFNFVAKFSRMHRDVSYPASKHTTSCVRSVKL